MITIADQLEQLIQDKENLVNALNLKTVEVSNLSTFTNLIPRILDIPPVEPYCPRHIRFANYQGESLRFALENLDLINVNNSTNMFYNCNKITELEISNMNTSNLQYSTSMFNGCSNLEELDLSNWNTINLIGSSYMFYNCKSLVSLNLNNWDVSNLNTMAFMLYNCSNLLYLDMNNWSNTYKINNMANVFGSCTNIKEINLSVLNTSNVVNMFGLFSTCLNVETIDISGFTSEKLTNTVNMFYRCNNLRKIIINNPNVFKITAATTLNLRQSQRVNIYVPDNLTSIYKTTQYWSDYSANIRPISELEV